MRKYNLLFTRHDGETDNAEIMTQKSHGWYESYIKIGKIRMQAIAGLETENDAYHTAVKLLFQYKEHAVI